MAKRKGTISVKLELAPDAMDVLDKLAVNSRRKSEVIDRLLMIAAERQAEIEQGINVPADQLTRTLMNLSVMREEFAQRKAATWTEEEFRLLLANENMPDEGLAALLDRSPGAVGVVRAGVKRWQNGIDHKGILSKMMIRILEVVNA
jgi:hypothetical protein